MEGHLTTRGHILVWLVLVGLTLGSFLVSRLPLGAYELVLPLAVAIAKTTLVSLFFMHLIEQRFMNAFVLIVSALVLVTLVSLTTIDVLSRHTFPKAPEPGLTDGPSYP